MHLGFVVLAALALPLGLARAGDAELFHSKRAELLVRVGQRHLEYGLELRKQGLPTQAAAQIALAVETSEGTNPGANTVLNLMRQYDDAFWKRHGSRPSKSKLDAYAKRSEKLALDNEKDQLELANWGHARKVERPSRDLYVAILRARNAPLAFDSKGQIVIPAGAIPKAASEVLRASAIEINGAPYVRDELLEKLPDLTAIQEARSERLLVRSTVSLEAAKSTHALCSELLPALEADLGARPERQLVLYLFAERKTYEALLDALDLEAHKVVSGVAMNRPPMALACAEGLDAKAVQGLCLHELTHHYVQTVSRAVFPSWYAEAYADTFGGPGTFTWDGTKLTTGGLLERSSIDALKKEGGTRPLRALLETNALDTWKESKEAGFAFYAQSWAFLRYLRTSAGAESARTLALWEDRCSGQAVGWQPNQRHGGATTANELFLESFGKKLHVLEDGFQAWLKTL